jgi:TrfA protein
MKTVRPIGLSDEQKEQLRLSCLAAGEIARQREEAAIVQLPLWYEEKRGTPNSFIRSALFAAIQSKDRIFIKNSVVTSQEGIEIKFTGEQLNQEDLTVWETLVHLARQSPLGDDCTLTGYSVLTMMELPTTAAQYKTLQASIDRLTACLVKIESERYVYGGSLVENFAIDKDTKQFKIQLNRKLIKLFGEDDWTGIEWQRRLQLRRKPLAQALHAYYSSHRSPFPVRLSTLQGITGSKNSQAASFKRQCRVALESLVEIGFLLSFSFDQENGIQAPSFQDGFLFLSLRISSRNTSDFERLDFKQ